MTCTSPAAGGAVSNAISAFDSFRPFLGPACPHSALWSREGALSVPSTFGHTKSSLLPHCQGCWLLSLTSSGIECSAQCQTEPSTPLKWSLGFHIYLQTGGSADPERKGFFFSPSSPRAGGGHTEPRHVLPAQWQLMNKIILVFALTRLASPRQFYIISFSMGKGVISPSFHTAPLWKCREEVFKESPHFMKGKIAGVPLCVSVGFG